MHSSGGRLNVFATGCFIDLDERGAFVDETANRIHPCLDTRVDG